MCGIVGCAGNILPIHEKVFRDLLVFDSIRGEHSTGVAVIDANFSQVVKSVGDPFELFDTRSYEMAMRGMHRALIGHNRYATQGAVNKRNAHPFEVMDLIGVHNGTLTNKNALEGGHQIVVDSEAIYNHIAIKGLRDAVNTMRGAWALVWWDATSESMNFLRNSERPLYITTATSGNNATIFWASEEWMLEVALSRHRVEHGDIVPLEEDMHVEVHVDKSRNLGKPVVTPMAAPKAIVYEAYSQKKSEGDGQKKTITTPTGATKNASSFAHLHRKNVLFVGSKIYKDTAGGRYLECNDVTNSEVDFRLYENGLVDIDTMVGVSFTGSMNGMCTRELEGTYFKISSSSIVQVEVVEEVEKFADHKGVMLTEKDWKDKYPWCSYCSDDLIPGTGNRFTSEGECLCPSCSSNKEVVSLVKLL